MQQQYGTEEDHEHTDEEPQSLSAKEEQGFAVIKQILRTLLQNRQVRISLLIPSIIIVGNTLIFAIQHMLWPILFILAIGGIVFFQWSQRNMVVYSGQRVTSKQEECSTKGQIQGEFFLTQIKTLDDIRLLTPRQFETLVADLMEQLGYTQVAVIGGSGDLCVDIKAVGIGGEQIAVQCKRYAPHNRITSDHMQKFIGMIYVHHRVDRGIYFTTSSYTKSARKLGEANRIELIEGEELVKIIRDIALDAI